MCSRYKKARVSGIVCEGIAVGYKVKGNGWPDHVRPCGS